MTRHLAIGDIHGCISALTALLDFVAPGPDDTIVTLGDYVDRGPDSAAVLEFLIESIILCILGGIIGLGLVYAVLAILSNSLPFELFLSFRNIIVGVGLSIGIGIISGIIPAYQAAKMDPVVAMRK